MKLVKTETCGATDVLKVKPKDMKDYKMATRSRLGVTLIGTRLFPNGV